PSPAPVAPAQDDRGRATPAAEPSAAPAPRQPPRRSGAGAPTGPDPDRPAPQSSSSYAQRYAAPAPTSSHHTNRTDTATRAPQSVMPRSTRAHALVRPDLPPNGTPRRQRHQTPDARELPRRPFQLAGRLVAPRRTELPLRRT